MVIHTKQKQHTQHFIATYLSEPRGGPRRPPPPPPPDLPRPSLGTPRARSTITLLMFVKN